MNSFYHRNRRPIAPVLALALGLSLLQANATVVCGPMLQGATTTNIYVLAECTVDVSAPMTVNFGTTAAYGSSASTTSTRTTDTRITSTDTTTPPTYVHVIKLTGLLPNTIYHYQLTGQGFTSADCTFRTLVNPGTPFRWAWTADFRNGAAVHGQICDRIRTQHNSPTPPLFDLTGGDYAGDNYYANWKGQWLTTKELDLEKVMPVYLSPGNHDGWAAGGNMRAFNQPPDSTGANGYYSFDCGDLHVIMGNNQYSLTGAQTTWIQQDVQASLKPWKIMGYHAPAYTYSSGGHGFDGAMVTLTTNVLEKNDVKVVLAGHNHFYQRNLINGIHHITCGAAGAPLYTPVAGNGTQVSLSDNCYLIGDVTPTTLNMVVYNNVGTVLDTINLTKLPAPAGLVAAPGNAQTNLSWDAVAGAASYTVYYGTTEGGPYPSKTTVTTTNTTLTGLTNKTPYYFVVNATDANGPSAISTQVSATPDSNIGQLIVGQWQMVSDHAATPQALPIPETPSVESRQAGVRRLEVTFTTPIMVNNPATAVTITGLNQGGAINLASLGINVNATAAGSVLAVTFANGGTPVALPDAAKWRFTLNPAAITGTSGYVLSASAATTRVLSGLVGDVDGNGRVGGRDLNTIANAGAFNPANAASLRADINGDGVIDQADGDAAWANRANRTDTLGTPP